MSGCWVDWDQLVQSAPADVATDAAADAAAAAVAAVVAVDAVAFESCIAMSVADCCRAS